MTLEIQPRMAALLRRRRNGSGRGDPQPREDAHDHRSEAPPPTVSPPRLPGRRNPKWVALGIVAICLGGLISYVVYARVATVTSVVAMAATVHRGEVVEASDLTTITLSGEPGLPTVSADQLSGLVGQRAVYDLVDGTVLPSGAIAEVVLPATKRALVGIKLTAGRAPRGFLVPGSPVRLVALPPANAEPDSSDPYTGKTYAARVVGQSEGPDAASVLVDVDVSSDQAPVIALLSAQERLTMVRDADR